MVSANDLKFYKGAGGGIGLGGAINTATQIPSSSTNALFPVVSNPERASGSDYYLLMYMKNTSAETMKNVIFWESGGTQSTTTMVRWGRGSTGKNGAEATIADIHTAPDANIIWRGRGTKASSSVSISTNFAPNDFFPIWVWWHVDAAALSDDDFSIDNDEANFSFEFTITQTGTGGTGDTGGGGSGGGGGGTGGNPPPAPTNWKMAIAGDWGCGSTTDKVHDLAAKYDFILGVGDNAYASASCWTDTFKDVKSKMNSAYGNHEYEESGGIGPYKTFFGHSKTYFSFNFQNVHVVVIDSNINMDSGSAQHNFVTSDLNTADNDPDVDWIFATMHHPWFGASSKHSYNNGNEVQAFHKLFTDHKVTLVMCGHNHNWQRTHQVSYNSGSPTNPSLFDSTAPYKKTNGGLIHVVTGTGGHDSGGSLYSLGSQPSYQAYQNKSNNGIWEIVASNSGQTLTCSFVNTSGNKFDTFVINAAP